MRFELAERGVKQVVGFDPFPLLNGGQGLQARLRPVNVGERDRAIKSDDRRIVEINQSIVERLDLPPVCAFVVLRGAVAGGDAGLKMILGDFRAGGRLRQMKHTAGNHRRVPAGPILFFEAEQVALRIHSRRQPRPVQQHQRQQRVGFGAIARSASIGVQ